METDVILVGLIAAGFVLGFLRGVIRQLLALGAWLLSFLFAAQLQGPLAEWLVTQEPEFSREYTNMLTFGTVFVVLFVIAFVAIEVVGTVSDLTTHPALDEVIGGLLGAGLVLLVIAAIVVALDSYYSVPASGPTSEIGILRGIHQGLDRSTLVGWLRDSLIPGLGSLLGILLPESVRRVMS